MFFRKTSSLINKAMLILAGVWAIPFVFILRFVKPLILIRLGTIRSDRIGHFAADTGHQFIKLHSQPINTVDFYWLEPKTSNEQLVKMVKRNFPVYSWVKYIARWNSILPRGDVHLRASTNTGSRDINGLLQKSQVDMMEFLADEDKIAKEWLRRQGWKDGEQFVCVLVRDSAYLDKYNLGNDENISWDYHNYRDSDIDSYTPALEWLANNGIWVLRMGKVANKPLNSRHSKIIDYVFHSERSDFLDVWLFANCSLCITTGSGPDMISDIYRVPLIVLNYLPLANIWSWSEALHAPKKLYWRKNGSSLSCKEYFDHSYYKTEDYDNNGIDIVDLSPAEIKDIIQEGWKRFEESGYESDADIDLHNTFWNIALQHYSFKKINDYIHPKSRISTTFIRAIPDWLA